MLSHACAARQRAASRPRSSMANSCVLLPRDNWLWRHFLGYSLTYCVFISSGQAPMQRPPWINAAFVKSFTPLSSCPQPLRHSSAQQPKQVHVGCQGSEKWAFRLRDSFHYRAQPTLDTMLKKYYSQKAPVCNKLKQDTPVYCAYLMCVHNAYLVAIWLGYT